MKGENCRAEEAKRKAQSANRKELVVTHLKKKEKKVLKFELKLIANLSNNI